MNVLDGIIQTHSKSQHKHISIDGLLKWNNKELTGIMNDGKGNEYSGAAVRKILMQEKAAGSRVIPIGDCDNFDNQVGCRGHGTWHLVVETGNG